MCNTHILYVIGIHVELYRSGSREDIKKELPRDGYARGAPI